MEVFHGSYGPFIQKMNTYNGFKFLHMGLEDKDGYRHQCCLLVGFLLGKNISHSIIARKRKEGLVPKIIFFHTLHEILIFLLAMGGKEIQRILVRLSI